MNLYHIKRTDFGDYYECVEMVVVACDANDAIQVSGVTGWDCSTWDDNGERIKRCPPYTMTYLGTSAEVTSRVVMSASVPGV